VASVAGAGALSLGSSAITGTRVDARATAVSTLVGAICGAAIGLAVNAPDDSVSLHVLLASGFVIWQVGYAAAHRLAPTGRAAAQVDRPA